MTATKPLVCFSRTISPGEQGRKDPDACEKGVAFFSPIGQAQVAKWQSCCHGNPPLFQLSLAGSDRCVKPCGQLESREMTVSRLFSVGKF